MSNILALQVIKVAGKFHLCINMHMEKISRTYLQDYISVICQRSRFYGKLGNYCKDACVGQSIIRVITHNGG